MGEKQIKKQVSRSETWLIGVVFHPFIKAQTLKKGSILKEICKQNAVFLDMQKHPPNIQIKVQKTSRKCCLLFPNVFWTFVQKNQSKKGSSESFQVLQRVQHENGLTKSKLVELLLWNKKSYIFTVNFTFEAP